jgi:hypothetical protein
MKMNQFMDNYIVEKMKFLEQHNKMSSPNIQLSHFSQFIS